MRCLVEVTAKLDEGKLIELCYLDFSKTSDLVKMLMHKLGTFGLSGELHYWVMDDLRNRGRVSVRVGNKNVVRRGLTSSFSQGSVLGLLWLLLQVDGLSLLIELPRFIFVDDAEVTGDGDGANLAGDLENEINWAINWNVPLSEGNPLVLVSGRIIVEAERRLWLIKTTE